MRELTEQQIWAVANGLDRLQDEDADFVEEFYHTLFEQAPQLRTMFSDDMMEQSRKLGVALDLVVRNLRSPETFMKPLQVLAQRHVAFGVVQEDYQTVRVALLDTIIQMMPGEISDDEVEAWDIALANVTELMVSFAYAKAS